MKRFIVVTNIWGMKWNMFHTGLKDYIKEEREYFDTMEEVNDYVNLFEGVYNGTDDKITFSKPCELWGYVVGDTKQFSITKWGGNMKYLSKCCKRNQEGIVKPIPYSNANLGLSFMYSFNNMDSKMNNLYTKDYIFRDENEIPQNYHWDNGEYEGWLQFRWGDGKNAIDYVESTKTEKPKEQEDVIENTKNWENGVEDYEDIENSALKEEMKERMKILENRW